MCIRKFILGVLFLCSAFLYAQKDTTTVKNIKVQGKLQTVDKPYNPLSPAKAAFYSAIFPGAGQIYNKKYWKAPIVWGAMATSTYFYIDNNSEYKRYRTAFKLREAGLNDEFTQINPDGSKTFLISRDGLINAQRVLRRNRDLSLLTTILFYVLQIVEASVNAHLLQFNTSDNLSLKPTVVPPAQIRYEAPKVGLTFKYSF